MAVNTYFKVIGLTQLGIKSKSTAPEADALTTRPSELLNKNQKNEVKTSKLAKLREDKLRYII